MTINADIEIASITIGAILKTMRLMGCVDIPEDAKALYAEVNNGTVTIHYLTESPKHQRPYDGVPYCVASIGQWHINESMFTFSKPEEEKQPIK